MVLSRYLRDCVNRAAAALDDDVDASITLRGRGLGLQVRSSTSSARRCDRAEARSGEGPCIVAMDEQALQLVAVVLDERRWDAWCEQAAAEGFVKAAAVPAQVTPGIAVALNLYSRRSGAWDAQTLTVAQEYIRLVAEGVHLQLVVTDLDDAADGLFRTLSDVVTVERALGAIQETDDCIEDEARRLLAAAADEHQITEHEMAEPILRDLAVGGRGDIVDGESR